MFYLLSSLWYHTQLIWLSWFLPTFISDNPLFKFWYVNLILWASAGKVISFFKYLVIEVHAGFFWCYIFKFPFFNLSITFREVLGHLRDFLWLTLSVSNYETIGTFLPLNYQTKNINFAFAFKILRSYFKFFTTPSRLNEFELYNFANACFADIKLFYHSEPTCHHCSITGIIIIPFCFVCVNKCVSMYLHSL